MTTPSSVLILGGRGRLGLAAARAFAQAGWTVQAQVRPGAVGPAIAGVQWLGVAPGDTAALAAWAHDAQVVVQGLNPAYTDRAWRTELPGLTQDAIAVSRALGATLMLPGNVYNFGAGMPPVLHEDTPQVPTTLKGRLRVAIERQILEATRDGAMKAVVIRAGDFFGGGTGTWLDLVMAKDLARGKFTHPGPLHIPTSWAFLPDLARVFVAVAERRHRLAAFETLHFAGHVLTGRDWAAAAAVIAKE
jgi:nucleoside-diphosphate-sugar epimerase